jgi:predicted Zn-dependent peptidase
MERSQLGNGIEVLSEHIPGVRSISAGVWVRQGGAHEGPGEQGVSHLLEHMVFKGTAQRSAHEIALSLEGLGGSLDAYTTREHTAYQARVLDEHLPEALDVLADLTMAPLLKDEDLTTEREVVLEEIAQVEDTPDDVVFDLHADGMWNGHAYGRPILGTAESVRAMPGDLLRELHASRYVGSNLVIAAAGNVRHEEFVERVSDHFGDVPEGESNRSVPVPEPSVRGDLRVGRESAQSHIVFGTSGPPHSSAERYALSLLSSALGGGMSSRLFQRVREELGLCYSVFSYQSYYRTAGVFGVYVGTRPATEEKAVEAIRTELSRVATEGLPEAEVEQTKRQMKGQVMLSLESTGSRLHRLASAALHEEPFKGLDGLLARIDAVSSEDISAVAKRYADPGAHFVLTLGPDRE